MVSIAIKYRQINIVLAKLKEAGIRLQKDKCQFLVTSIFYLGYRIDQEGIHPMPEKDQAVKEAPRPHNKTELKSYLRLLSYYNRFMPHLPSVLSPLYELLCCNVPWSWSSAADELFATSKSLLTNDKVLTHFDPQLELVLQCDASN